MLKDYSFKILRIAVDYVARASVLRALERPRASDISWDPRLLFAVTCTDNGYPEVLVAETYTNGET